MAAAEEPTTWFTKDWQVYQQVLEGDYLEHKSLYRSAGELLVQARLALGRPLRLLDLGCGDADYLCRTFSTLSGSHPESQPLLQSYTGVDLSRPALDIAGTYLQRALGTSSAVTLDLGDMLAWVAAEERQREGFDVVVVSFALHHLQTQDKLQLLAHARQLLASPGGVLLLIDVFRRQDEGRDVYLSRFMDDINTTWTALDAEGKKISSNHVTAFDLPESVATYQELSCKAGFKAVRVVAEGSKGFSKFLVLDT